MEKENIKKLILVILGSLIVLSLVFWIINNKEDKIKEPDFSAEYQSTQRNMYQLQRHANSFKEENGSYNITNNNISVDFCSLDKNIFTGTGNGHVLCSNIVNISSEGLRIKINNEEGDSSKYCIQKKIDAGQNIICMDYSGYVGISSGCDASYTCGKL